MTTIAVSEHQSYIQLLDPNTNNPLWTKEHLPPNKYKQVKDYCKSREIIPILKASLQPVRTDTWENLAKDFFLPTLINHALKIEDTFWKYIAIAVSFILDVTTLFLCRVWTIIPRMYSNSGETEHPLKKYLKDEGVDPKLLESNFVRIKTGNENGYETKHIHFIEMPIYEGHDHRQWSSSVSFS